MIRSWSAITAIDLKTLQRMVVISGLGGRAMDIDTGDNKLYFQDGNGISRVKLGEEICVEVIVKDASADDIAIDWEGRRILWTESEVKKIFVAKLDGKKRKVEINTTGNPYGIALDPLKR